MLLIHKKRGIGAGRINGPGGKVDAGESPLAAAIRETQEETGVTPVDPRLQGELWFHFSSEHIVHCLIYLARDYEGLPQETSEALPEWFALSELPYDRMWEDDRHWLPLLIAEKSFEGRVAITGEKAGQPVFSFIKNGKNES